MTIDGHTCIADDGGTPNRRCEQCALDEAFRQLMTYQPEPDGPQDGDVVRSGRQLFENEQ